MSNENSPYSGGDTPDLMSGSNSDMVDGCHVSENPSLSTSNSLIPTAGATKAYVDDQIEGHSLVHTDQFYIKEEVDALIPDFTDIENDIARIELQNAEVHGAGIASGGTVVPTGGITFMILPYVAYAYTEEGTLTRVISEAPRTGFSTLYDGTNVICVAADNSINIFDSDMNTGEYVIMGVIYTAYVNTLIVEIANTPTYCSGLSQRMSWLALNALGALVEDGCTLSEGSTPLTLVAAEGHINVNFQSYPIEEATSFLKMYKTADYGWVVETANPDAVDPTLWNDTTQNYGAALVAVTATYWTKSIVYRSSSGTFYFTYAQAQYATEELAKAAPIPVLPDNIASVAVFIALIVSKAEDTSIGMRIQDVRPYLPRIFGYGSSSAGVSLAHSALTGLGADDHSSIYFNATRGDARYALLANGVTGGDSHNHNGGDGAQIAHADLSGAGTTAHSAIDSHISNAPVFETSTANIKMDGVVSCGVEATMPRADHIHATDTSREPSIGTKNTAFNQNFETSTTNIKMDGSVSVGVLTTIPRADHIHATDTSREASIGTKNTAFNVNFETSTTNIVMNGAVSVGTTSTVPRADHRHATDTSRLAATRGNWMVFHSNGSGVFTELALGALGTVLTSAGPAAAPTFSAPGAATYGNWKLFHSNGSGAMTEVALGESGTILKCNGTAAAPTVARIGNYSHPVTIPNLMSSAQTFTAGSANVLTGTLVRFPTSALVVGARIAWEILVTKTTAAGTGTWQMFVKFGTAGTTSDAAIATWTSGTNTAAIDQMYIRVVCQILTLGASATAQCNAYSVNRLTQATGLGSIAGPPGSTATFNSDATQPYFHIDINPSSTGTPVITSMSETNIIAMG